MQGQEVSECLTTNQPRITTTGTTHKQLVNTVTLSSTMSAGVGHLIQLFPTPAKLWCLPTNWRSETRLSSTRSAFGGTLATSEFKLDATLQHTGTFFPFDNGTSIAHRE